MALVLESQGNDKSSFAYCNKEMSQSRHGRRKYEIKPFSANTKTCGQIHEGPIYRWPNVTCPVGEANQERAQA